MKAFNASLKAYEFASASHAERQEAGLPRWTVQSLTNDFIHQNPKSAEHREIVELAISTANEDFMKSLKVV